jgi:hypothetical protein
MTKKDANVMVKVVVGSFKSTKAKPKGSKTLVTEKRVRDTDGQLRTLRTLDAASRTFGTDLQYVFGKNVAKARRDNKRTTGANDVVVAKR